MNDGRLILLSTDATVDRYKKGWSRPDLFSHFIQEDGQLQPWMTLKDLEADVRAAILAGNALSYKTVARKKD